MPLLPLRAIVIAEGGYIFPSLAERYCIDDIKQAADVLHTWIRKGLVQKISKMCNEQITLKQIRYYDCYSYDDSQTSEGERNKEKMQTNTKRDLFINKFKMLPIVNFLPGRLIINGLKPARRLDSFKTIQDGKSVFVLTENDVINNFQQKEVDTLITMDVIRIANERLADIIIFITDDSDFTPLFKEVRSLGITVVLHSFHEKRNSTGALLENSDYCLRLEANELPLKQRDTKSSRSEARDKRLAASETEIDARP